MHAELTDAQVDQVIDAVRAAVGRLSTCTTPTTSTATRHIMAPLRRPRGPTAHLGLPPARLEHARRLRRRHGLHPAVPEVRLVPGVRPARLGRRPAQLHGRGRPVALPPRARAAGASGSRRRSRRTGTIVYPFHGWEGQQVLGSHTAYIEEVKATEGDVPITVCLHWNEYDNPKVRREYEDAGVRVVTHGQRGYLWQDTDVAFLYRQLHEMRRHRRVVSNRMSSAILYAASAGVEVGVYGDPMALESDHAVLGGVGKPRRIWPEMHQFSVPDGLRRGRSRTRSSGPTSCSCRRRSSTPSAGRPRSSGRCRRRARRLSRTSCRSSSAVAGASTAPTATVPRARRPRRRARVSGACPSTTRRTARHRRQARGRSSRGRRGRRGPRIRAVVRGPHGGAPDGAGRAPSGCDGAQATDAEGRRRLRAQRAPAAERARGASVSVTVTGQTRSHDIGRPALDVAGEPLPLDEREGVGRQAVGRTDRAHVGRRDGVAGLDVLDDEERAAEAQSLALGLAGPDARLAEGLPGDRGLAHERGELVGLEGEGGVDTALLTRHRHVLLDEHRAEGDRRDRSADAHRVVGQARRGRRRPRASPGCRAGWTTRGRRGS